MNANKIREMLKEVEQKLKDEGVEEAKQLELSILAGQLEMQFLVSSFDSVKDLDDFTVVNLSQLCELTKKVDQKIKNELARRCLVDEIILIAKSGLKAAGFAVG